MEQTQPEIESRIPEDRSYALLQVLLHGILRTRSRPFDRDQQLFDLMDALHNIPIYLHYGGEDFWASVQLDLDRYDERYATSEANSLKQIYSRALQEFIQSHKNRHTP